MSSCIPQRTKHANTFKDMGICTPPEPSSMAVEMLNVECLKVQKCRYVKKAYKCCILHLNFDSFQVWHSDPNFKTLYCTLYPLLERMILVSSLPGWVPRSRSTSWPWTSAYALQSSSSSPYSTGSAASPASGTTFPSVSYLLHASWGEETDLTLWSSSMLDKGRKEECFLAREKRAKQKNCNAHHIYVYK